MFKRKTDFSYYSSYNTKKSRLKVSRVTLIVAVCVVLVIGLIGFLNRTRISLMMDGYSWSQTSDILALDSDEISLIQSYDKLDKIDTWLDNSKKVKLYDEYEKYSQLYPKLKTKTIIKNVNKIFGSQYPKLEALGYSDKDVWNLLKQNDESDFQYLIDNSLSAKETKNYREVKGCILKNMNGYIEKYREVKNYNYAVDIVNYPFLIANSKSNVEQHYTITNPDELLTLVKKGFFLQESYEPKDLVTPDMPIAPDCKNKTLRKSCSDALIVMYKAAKEEGYDLVLNSGYRSYTEQQKTYAEFEKKYGGQYAAEYVAIPGASEHQTGLGVDLTSKSVVDKQKNVFGDTSEYKWVVKNAYKYGFIIRFESDKSNITGIEHEPWHLRYVGKEVAKKIADNNWTFEEYCLYNNVMPKLTAK